MESSNFSLEKTDRRSTELGPEADQRLSKYRFVESSSAETAAAPGYDSLLDYWQMLIRHRKTLLGFVLAGLVGALVISLLQTRIYRARTSLEIQDFNANLLDIKGVDASDSAGSYVTPESYMETQVKILQSESVLGRVIDKLNLHAERPASRWRIFKLWKSSHVPEREELIRQAERNLTVRTSGNSRLLEVLYESSNPQVAADFANTLVSEFIEQSQEMRWKSTQRTAEWLTSHLDEMKTKLEQSEVQLQDYVRTSGLTVTSDKQNLAENGLKQLQDELSKAQADRIASQAKFEEAKNKPADSVPEISDDPTMREYRQRMTELQRQYAELSATLTPEHYKVQRVQAQITELQFNMLQERSNIQRRIGNEYSAALRREKLLSQADAEQEKVVADQSSKAIHYDTLKREVDSTRQIYEAMLQRVKQAGLATAMRASNVLVVDPAKPPLLPYRPSIPINSAIGLFSGVFLGFGFVLLRERVDRRISAPGDSQTYLELPELGVIPLDEAIISRQIGNGSELHRSPALHSGSTSRPPLGDCPELATWKRKPSLVAECARTTLTSILLPTQDGDHPQVVVLTSPCPGDGKTTVACNLSIAMTEIGRKVLMIDGDLRKPRLHKVFSVANSWGLSDVLWAETPIETVPISHLVSETEVSGLCLLPAGSCGGTPTNLFYSPRMTRLLKRLRKEFDMIMIDAPPMIHLADARVLGRLADGVILVVRAGQTTTESALFASQRFAEDGTRVMGTVLNSWDPSSGRHYGYESYGDYKAGPDSGSNQ
jgi:capsular exopolysaccharide synthesis family protein